MPSANQSFRSEMKECGHQNPVLEKIGNILDLRRVGPEKPVVAHPKIGIKQRTAHYLKNF